MKMHFVPKWTPIARDDRSPITQPHPSQEHSPISWPGHSSQILLAIHPRSFSHTKGCDVWTMLSRGPTQRHKRAMLLKHACMVGVMLNIMWITFGIAFDIFKNEEATATHKHIGVLINNNGQTTLEKMKTDVCCVPLQSHGQWPTSNKGAGM